MDVLTCWLHELFELSLDEALASLPLGLGEEEVDAQASSSTVLLIVRSTGSSSSAGLDGSSSLSANGKMGKGNRGS